MKLRMRRLFLAGLTFFLITNDLSFRHFLGVGRNL